MNHITNDRGEVVIAVGAPGSVERIKVERPKLIERLNSLYNCQARIDVAVEEIRRWGVTNHLETNSLIRASHFINDPLAGLVLSV